MVDLEGSYISSETKDNPGHVTVTACNLKHAKIDLALFGPDGRAGIVKDIADISSSLKSVEEWRKSEVEQEKTKKRDWRGFLYSVIGGIIVAGASWIISNLH